MITINQRRRFNPSMAREYRAESYSAFLQDDGISAGLIGNRYHTRQWIAPWRYTDRQLNYPPD